MTLEQLRIFIGVAEREHVTKQHRTSTSPSRRRQGPLRRSRRGMACRCSTVSVAASS